MTRDKLIKKIATWIMMAIMLSVFSLDIICVTMCNRYQNTPVPGGNGGSSPQFVFAPNITITGDADRQQIASIMEDEYEKFKAFMDKYNRENNRTRYA